MLENQKGSSRWTYIIRNPWNSSDWMEMGNLQPIMSFFFINRYSLRAGSKSGQADRGRGSGTVLSMMERGATQVEPRRLCKISTPKLCQAIHRRNIWPFSPPQPPWTPTEAMSGVSWAREKGQCFSNYWHHMEGRVQVKLHACLAR